MPLLAAIPLKSLNFENHQRNNLMKRQITQNIASNYALTAVQMVLGILLVPFLISKLGAAPFGVVVLAESMIAFFEVGIASFRIALSRYVTFSLAKEESKEFQEYISSGRYILILTAFIFLIIGLFISAFFSNMFQVPAGQEMQSKILVFLISLSIVITMPNIIYWSILYAKQRLDLINLSTSLGLILRAVLVFIFFSVLPKDWVNLTAYGVIYFFIKWAQNYFIYVWHKKILPGVKPEIRFFRWNKVREMMSFSFHTSLGSISTTIYENMTNILVNIFYGPAANSLYAISLKIPATLKSLFLQATWSLTPTFIDLTSKNDKKRLETLFFMYSKFVAIVALPAIIVLTLAAKPIIALWVGKSFGAAADLLPFHMLPLLITLPFAATNCLNTANAKVKVPNGVMFITAILNVGLGVLLARFLHLELFGFAAATSLCVIISNGIFTPLYACRTSGISYRKMWINSFCKPFVMSALLSGLVILILFAGHWKVNVTGIILSLVLCFIFGSSFFKWGLDSHESQYIFGFIKRFKFNQGT